MLKTLNMPTIDDLRKRLRPSDQATRRVTESSVPPVVLPQVPQAVAPAPQPGVDQATARVGGIPPIAPPSVAAQQVTPAPQPGVDQASARVGVQPQATQPPVAVGAQTSPQVQQPPAQPDRPFYSAFMEQIKQAEEPYKPMTNQEIEDEKRKRRSQASFAALGDALSSLASLYGTTKGALPVFDPNTALSPRQLERADKLKLEKEGNRDKWLNYQKMKFDIEGAKEQQDYIRGKAEQERADRLAAQEAARKEREQAEETRKKERAEDIARRGKERAEDAGEREKARQHDLKKQSVSLGAAAAEGKKDRESSERIAKGRASGSRGGSGTLSDLWTTAYRGAQISELFDQLPVDMRKFAGTPVRDKYTGELTGEYEQPTDEQKLESIGRYMNKNADFRKVVEEKLKKNYPGGNDNEDYGPFDSESKEKLTEGQPDI